MLRVKGDRERGREMRRREPKRGGRLSREAEGALSCFVEKMQATGERARAMVHMGAFGSRNTGEGGTQRAARDFGLCFVWHPQRISGEEVRSKHGRTRPTAHIDFRDGL